MTLSRLIALLSLLLTPSSAFAARYTGWSKLLDGEAADTASNLLPYALIFLGLMFLYCAIMNPDFLNKDADQQALLRLVGPKIQRGIWLVLGVLALNGAVPLFNAGSQDLSEYAIQKCGAPGTQSFINDEGLCDCPAGYTWFNEEDVDCVECIPE